mmetsp:Transcript_35509/g.63357  ORF Transcript_35509/g.63357 Transcript_35509/m.63357 type:complete len:216 (+) Transcript_35509:2667-3314(+)
MLRLGSSAPHPCAGPRVATLSPRGSASRAPPARRYRWSAPSSPSFTAPLAWRAAQRHGSRGSRSASPPSGSRTPRLLFRSAWSHGSGTTSWLCIPRAGRCPARGSPCTSMGSRWQRAASATRSAPTRSTAAVSVRGRAQRRAASAVSSTPLQGKWRRYISLMTASLCDRCKLCANLAQTTVGYSLPQKAATFYSRLAPLPPCSSSQRMRWGRSSS